jgi:hypothetical protein
MHNGQQRLFLIDRLLVQLGLIAVVLGRCNGRFVMIDAQRVLVSGRAERRVCLISRAIFYGALLFVQTKFNKVSN